MVRRVHAECGGNCEAATLREVLSEFRASIATKPRRMIRGFAVSMISSFIEIYEHALD
jgi:hypothetical protein